MWNTKVSGFMMADSIAGLVIVAMGINLFFICEHQLWLQNQNLHLKMATTRLGKEASDLYAIRKQPATLKQGDLTAKATSQEVIVYDKGRCIWRVKR